MDERQEALKRIEAAEKEITAAKKILEKPDPRIGKLCVCSDTVEGLAVTKYTQIVSKIVSNDINPIVTVLGGRWKHARLLTEGEKEKYL
jgi:hypothetical protein